MKKKKNHGCLQEKASRSTPSSKLPFSLSCPQDTVGIVLIYGNQSTVFIPWALSSLLDKAIHNYILELSKEGINSHKFLTSSFYIVTMKLENNNTSIYISLRGFGTVF